MITRYMVFTGQGDDWEGDLYSDHARASRLARDRRGYLVAVDVEIIDVHEIDVDYRDTAEPTGHWRVQTRQRRR